MPSTFNMSDTIDCALEKGLPLFGVCLGLQGIVEYFGGTLQELPYPMHGKPSRVEHCGSKLFENINSSFIAGRYHSLAADAVPECLAVTARTEEGMVMAVEHATLPIYGVQFHPESIMTLADKAGHQLTVNVVNQVLDFNHQNVKA